MMSDTAYNFGRQLVMEKKAFLGTAANVALSFAAPYVIGSLGKAFARKLALKAMMGEGAGTAGGIANKLIRRAPVNVMQGAANNAERTAASGLEQLSRRFEGPLHPSSIKAFQQPMTFQHLAGDKGFQKDIFQGTGGSTKVLGNIAHGMQHPATGVAAMMAPAVLPVFPDHAMAKMSMFNGTTHNAMIQAAQHLPITTMKPSMPQTVQAPAKPGFWQSVGQGLNTMGKGLQNNFGVGLNPQGNTNVN